ncbi:hypothetical protein M3Y95_00959000 [Aphelenchoides besseyi]|nr:hypothetical protein M3Y95_00959000 [Aphelenchoides besseyi]
MGNQFSRSARNHRRLKIAEKTIVELQQKKRELRRRCHAQLLKLAGVCFVISIISGLLIVLFIGISLFSLLITLAACLAVGTFVFLNLRRIPQSNYQRKRNRIVKKIEALRSQCDVLRNEQRQLQSEIVEIVNELDVVDSTVDATSENVSLICSHCNYSNGSAPSSSARPAFKCQKCGLVNESVNSSV